MITEAWNSRHIRLTNEPGTNGIGLGGLLRLGYVNKQLEKKARPVRSAIISPDVAKARAVGFKRKPPNDIETISAREARDWCIRLGIPVSAQKKDRIKRIKQWLEENETICQPNKKLKTIKK